MNFYDIVTQTQCPLTDEKLKELIKIFIECNCSTDEFYKTINIGSEEKENPYLLELYRKMFSLSNEGERYVNKNTTWRIVSSSEETLSVPNQIEKRVPIYRIYLNAKGKDKATIIEEYIKQCEAEGRQYKLKYALEDGRDDEIVILSYAEDLAPNVEKIERITEGMTLGEPAKLAGRYKEKIGIGEEYIQAPRFSYTQTRLGMIQIIMKKYYLDHIDEFEADSKEKEEIKETYIDYFKEEAQEIESELGDIPNDQYQERKELLNKQLAYNNNFWPGIEFMRDYHYVYNPEVMEQYMSSHFEEAIPELINSYRLASKIYGISENGIFSTRTEEMIQQMKTTGGNFSLESIKALINSRELPSKEK